MAGARRRSFAALPCLRGGPGAIRRHGHFVVTYAGAGWWRTSYHSEPPDPGGAHDTNDAHDTSRQRWSLRFSDRLTIRRCAGRAGCVNPDELTAATGTTTAAG